MELKRLGRIAFACAFFGLGALCFSGAAAHAATVNVNFFAQDCCGIVEGTFYGLEEGGASAPTSVVITNVVHFGPIPDYYSSGTVPSLPVPVPFPFTIFPFPAVGDSQGQIPLTADGALCSNFSLNGFVCGWSVRQFFTVSNPNDSYFSLSYSGQTGIIQFGEVFQGHAYFVAGFFTSSVETTPLPAALPLFATGLGALGLLGWRRSRKAAARTV